MAGPMVSAPAMVRTSTGIGLVELAAGLLAQFLGILGDDALPVIAENLCALPGSLSKQARETVTMWKGWLDRDPAGKAWQAWNLSRERARDTRLPSVCPLSTQ